MTIWFDYKRRRRIGLPESVYCEAKSVAAIESFIAEASKKKSHPILLTRLSEDKYEKIGKDLKSLLDYDLLSRTAFLNGVFPSRGKFVVAVACAGTSDLPVASEVQRTLYYLGIRVRLFADIGVSGLWRLRKRLPAINSCDVVIVVAGMDAALASVVGGLTAQPLIAVPTSVGYGVAQNGVAAIQSMLASCAPGVLVTNIDNGYGAACAAARMLSLRKTGR